MFIVHGWLRFWQIHILLFSVFIPSSSRNCCKVKKLFASISKSIVTYITITLTNISNNKIKQYYDIIKTFKVLVIVKMWRVISQYVLQTKLSSVYLSHHNMKSCTFHTYIYKPLQRINQKVCNLWIEKH